MATNDETASKGKGKKTKPSKKSRKAIQKKDDVKSKTQPKASPRTEFEKAWKEYSSALNIWKEALSQWQKATNRALITYQDACQKALESDAELLKKVSSSWEDAWEEIGPEYVKQQASMIKNMFKQANPD